MPGFWGSHLGIIDLMLEQQAGRWRINNFHVEARPIYQRDGGKILALAEPDTQIAAVFAKAHVQTREWVNEPIGETQTPIHSYFVWAGIDRPTELINKAQLDYGRSLLQGTALSALPLLSAAAPFRVGYTPDAYIDLKAGPIAIRDAANMYIYSNTVSIVRVNGAVLKEWLEHSARVFHRIDPELQDAQALLDPRVATYNFDVIAGLEYEIDLSQPQRTDASGRVAMAQAHRIKNLLHAGRQVDPEQDFLVVTNNYRAGGGGRFPFLDGRNIVLNDATTNRDALIEFIRKSSKLSVISETPWKFSFGGSCKVWFDSAVSSRVHMAESPKLSLRGPGREGYLRYELQLN
jgi:2',3'-cyclic-nucleotide 2'-phosphodiesterase/3'-nucleotidase